MILFTQKDYLEYSQQIKFTLKETSEKYILDKSTHQYNDKIFKELLSDKKEFINFISKYLENNELGTLSENNIEKYDKEFITSEFRKKESDIIYKITNENTYILVEHQSRIDYNMPERIAEYCMELTRTIRKNNPKSVWPIICPIVLYTGPTKWNINYKIKNNYLGLKTFNFPKFNLIDINNYTKEQLINEDTGISKALLFEKINSREEFKVILDELFKKLLTSQELKYIEIMFTHSNKIQNLMPKNKEIYIKKLRNGDDETMKFEKYFIELLQDEQRKGEIIGEKRGEERGEKRGEKLGEKRGEKIGIAKAINQMVKEMLRKQISDEDIMDIAKINKEELDKLKMA